MASMNARLGFVCFALSLCLVTPLIAADESAAVASLEKLGGQVKYDDQKNVIGLSLMNVQIGNSDLKVLPTFSKLQTLELWGADISDKGMDFVKDLTTLTSLTLENTDVTVNGLKKLTPLSKLKVIG